MLQIRKITPADFDEVHAHLLTQVDPAIPRSRWQRTFGNYTGSDEHHCGYVLTDGGRLVGVLGAIFSERQIEGAAARFCNIHCWYVQEEYRPRSLMLMQPILRLKDHTITDLTPSIRVASIAKRLGFITLDRSAVILPALGRLPDESDATIEDVSDRAEAWPGLDPETWRLHRDHQDSECRAVWLQQGQEHCYIAYSLVSRHRWPYCLVHCVTNPGLLARQHARFRSFVLSRTGGRYVAIDSRLLAGQSVPRSFRVRSNEQLYRPHRVEPHQVDSLYTELAFLKHSIFPGLHQRVRYAVKRCFPQSIQKLFPPA